MGLLVTILASPARSDQVYRAAALLLLCIIGYLLAPLAVDYGFGFPGGSWLTSPVILTAILVPPAFWYFCCAVFYDNFRITPIIPLLVLATALVAIYAFVTGPRDSLESVDWIAQGAKLGWVATAFAALLRDWRGDLVESRRRLRFAILLVAGLYILAVLLIELALGGEAPAALEALNSGLIFLLVTGLSLHMLSLNGDNVFNRLANSPVQKHTGMSTLALAVQEEMSANRRYAEEGLTIEKLAARLGTQAHRLRKVINGELGYRNFNSFINTYRVQEVAERLRQADFQDTPLLTLALDAGFRSLAPFNRSFKEHFQLTPSEFRDRISQK